MIKVMFVTDALMIGGIETQLVDLVTRLDRSQFAPSVVCLYGPHARDLHYDKVLQAADIPVYCLNRSLNAWDKVYIVQKLAALIGRVQPHIVQAENYHANLLTGFAHLLHPSIRFIGTQRGMYTTKQLTNVRLIQRFYDHYIVSAPHIREQLLTIKQVQATKVETILNGIDVARFAAPPTLLLRSKLAPKARRLLVSMGRISSQKRMHLIAEAMGILKQRQALPPDVQIWIVGPVQDQPLYQSLLATIQRYNLRDQLKLFGGTDRPDEYYAASDATILYSIDESLPCVMLESLAAGRPVLISDEANAAGAITDGQTGWVAPVHDTQAFANVLHQVLMMPSSDLLSMKIHSAKHASAFDVSRLVEQYRERYRSLVGMSRR